MPDFADDVLASQFRELEPVLGLILLSHFCSLFYSLDEVAGIGHLFLLLVVPLCEAEV